MWPSPALKECVDVFPSVCYTDVIPSALRFARPKAGKLPRRVGGFISALFSKGVILTCEIQLNTI